MLQRKQRRKLSSRDKYIIDDVQRGNERVIVNIRQKNIDPFATFLTLGRRDTNAARNGNKDSEF